MALSSDELLEFEKLVYDKGIRESKTDLGAFTKFMHHDFIGSDFHDKYYKILEAFAYGLVKRLIITVPPQHGKLLPADTPILTTKGWKDHGDLSVGDYVFGQDGKPKKVLANSGVYDWNVQRMRFKTGEEILCAKEHIWRVNIDYDNNGGVNQYDLESQDIFKRKPRRSPSIDCSPALEIPEAQLPIDPYVLGCWLGDGHARQGVLTVGQEDIEHFSKLGEAREVKKGIYRVLIDGLTTKLRLNNLILNKRIPIEYLLSSKEQRLELLRGLMDTDGCVDKKGQAEFTQKSGQLSKDVYALLRSLGVKARIKTYDAKLDGRIVGKKDRILFNPSKGDLFFKLTRKQERISNKPTADRSDKYKFFIDTIEDCGKVKGNCITVEGSMYLAGYEMIPTHNSEGSSRMLPAFIFGLNPHAKITLISYNQTFASKFNRDVQRIIDTQKYYDVFNHVTLNQSNVVTKSDNTLRNSEEFEIIDHRGYFKAVGVGGGLTGNTVDIAIMDDLYKDYQDATSPTISQRVWEWYLTVLKTRLHNDSQELMVFTRWDENDAVGRLEQAGKVVEYDGSVPVEELAKSIDRDVFIKINFEAIKEGEPTALDPREKGKPLFPQKHDLEKLTKVRELDKSKFDALYQGNPTSKEGLLYQGFETYRAVPDFRIVNAYCDTADTGSDYLCSVVYGIPYEGEDIYILDVVYTQESMEVTEPMVAMQYRQHRVRQAHIESNSGGRSFGRVIDAETTSETQIVPFTQTANKQGRIFTNSASVNRVMKFPVGWEHKFNQFHSHVSTFKKDGRNAHDDCADVLTGIYEKERLENQSPMIGW